ncbi:MAG: hypothetical protein CVU57_16135 [Deltaproteobacteria bacterium HGW-Deltaproteobacteria-15]|jgi:hypothetical protein|nr:MAG: hypothetical protein CVU57_16135 [Deltaproteobacteria bacterium HGW-Deltaproteobacteria-15]
MSLIVQDLKEGFAGCLDILQTIESLDVMYERRGDPKIAGLVDLLIRTLAQDITSLSRIISNKSKGEKEEPVFPYLHEKKVQAGDAYPDVKFR